MTSVFETLLVPVDFSRGSRLALDYARRLARRLGAGVHVLHVIDDTAGMLALGEHVVDVTEMRRERRCDARQHMNAMLNGLSGQPMTDEIAAGPVAATIARSAADIGASIIVMGTHGRTGLRHALLGSVAEDVIRAARCPVLTIRESAVRAELVSAGESIAV